MFASHTRLSISVLALLFLCVPLVSFAEGEVSTIDNILWNIVVSFFGMFTGLAGYLLNFAVQDYVIGFGDQFLKSGVGNTVNVLWETVRNIFNLTFIFGLVFIGLRMILNSDDSNTRRYLIHLILAALLVNFSLFITKTVVDFTNIMASQIAYSFPNKDGDKIGISDAFMNQIGVTGIFKMDLENVQVGNAKLNGGGIYGYIFGSAVILLVMTFVFAAGGILLLIRYAVLCIYMLLSPLMFIGWVFPQLENESRKYWKGFLARAFFAPVYLLLIYFSYSILAALYTEKQILGEAPAFTKGFGQGGGEALAGSFAGTFPPFILACIFLIASIVVAQKMGAEGASAAMKVGQNLRGRVQRGVGSMTAGTVALGGRKLVGATANRIAESEKIQRMARRSGLAGLAGRAIADTAHIARTSSFDVRSIGGVGKALEVGEGKKGGYAADQKTKEKKEKERAARYSTQDDTQFYKDAGEKVGHIKTAYDEIISNLDQTMAELSRTTDPTTRQHLMEEMRTLNQKRKDIEDNKGGDPDLEAFNYIRKNNKALRQNTYAANLERRSQDFWTGGGHFGDQQGNTRAADAIRLEMSKDTNAKLIDAINNLNKE